MFRYATHVFCQGRTLHFVDLQNSNKLVSVEEVLAEGARNSNNSISNKVLERITDWTCHGKLPQFTVHQVSIA